MENRAFQFLKMEPDTECNLVKEVSLIQTYINSDNNKTWKMKD